MKHVKQTFKRYPQQAPAIQAAITLSAVLLLALALPGCASLPTDLVATDTVNVVRLDSPKARISSVFVGDKDGLLLVRGRLEKRHFGRSPIPGHLHIEVLGKDGLTLGEEITRYYRRSGKSRISRFSREFSVQPGDVRTVRIIHHAGEDRDINCTACRDLGRDPALSAPCSQPDAWYAQSNAYPSGRGA